MNHQHGILLGSFYFLSLVYATDVVEKKKTHKMIEFIILLFVSYLSHCLRVQLAMIHKETMNTRRTVPGQMVMRVLRTKRVLKLIRFNAPILREDASVNSLECSSITLKRAHKNKYKRKGILCGTCHYCLKAYVIRRKRFANRKKAKGCFIFFWRH